MQMFLAFNVGSCESVHRQGTCLVAINDGEEKSGRSAIRGVFLV